MNKKELEFRTILNALDSDFAEYMLQYDYELLEKEGVTRINNFTFKRDYWSKPTDEVTINPNANAGNTGDKKSFTNLISEMVSPCNKLSAFTLFRKYGNKLNFNGDNLVKNIIEGDVYYHNSTLIDIPYCTGLSVYPLVSEGLQFGSLKSSPPKRPTSFVNQVIRYIQIASNMFAGATALTDFIQNYSYYTYLNPSYTDKERENDFQNVIHGVSDEVRIGTQSPFTNVSISSPETMRYSMSNYLWGDNIKISDLMDEIMKNQKIYANFIAQGQLDKGKPVGLPYRFPITTLVADPSFEKEYPVTWKEIIEGNSNLCHLNIFNSWNTPLKSLSMCCRLNPSLEDMLKLSVNNTFGSFLQIGSHGVCSVNLPRIAYKTKNEDEFIAILKEKMEIARKLLKIQREEILQKRRIKYNFFFNHGYLNLKRNFFSTIGFIGFPNALEILDMKITEESGLKFAKKILQIMKAETVRYTEEDGYLYNIEEVPAESASGTLAQKDKLLYKGQYEFYDSQFIPLSYDIDIMKRIELEGELQEHCTGGSISHINLDSRPNPESLNKLTKTILERSKLRQFAFNSGFTVCKSGHNSMGIYSKCPECNSTDVDIITRIVGYFTPVSSWNKAKQLEFKTRKWGTI